jgi:hypothetical protein
MVASIDPESAEAERYRALHVGQLIVEEQTFRGFHLE